MYGNHYSYDQLETGYSPIRTSSEIVYCQTIARTRKIKRKCSSFFVDEGHLFRKCFNQVPLKCTPIDEMTQVIREIHAGDCDEH